LPRELQRIHVRPRASPFLIRVAVGELHHRLVDQRVEHAPIQPRGVTVIAVTRDEVVPSLSACARRDTLPAGTHSPEEVEPVTHSDEEPAAADNDGARIAVIFVSFLLVAAVLFTLYFLLWDGGGNT